MCIAILKPNKESISKEQDLESISNYDMVIIHTPHSSFSEIDFEYSEPKSILAQQFESINNKKYGELNFISDVSKKSV